MINDLKEIIDVSQGRRKTDLALRGGRLVNVFSGEIYDADLAVHRGKIAGIGSYEAKRYIDVKSKYILPGLIDSHMHLESSMLTPAEFARAALPHGTTAVVADPHEIANVLGKKGIRYLLDASEGVPLDFYFMLPSCVPATRLETSGSRLSAADLAPFLRHERVLGLAEMMNYPGVLSGEREVLRKIGLPGGGIIDGHAPGLSGKDLSAYVAAGISSDHECTTAEEAIEKIRLGMTIFIREGSAAKDLEALLPAVTPVNSQFFCLATDDIEPEDLKLGGINLVMKKAVRLGVDPVTALRMATINPARHFGLRRKGAVLPGYDADMVIVGNLKDFTVEKVYKNGRLAAENGKTVVNIRSVGHALTRGTIRIRPLRLQDIRLKAKTSRARVMELIPGSIETGQSIMPVAVKDGCVISDTERDVVKLIVIERHKATGNMGFGLVKGFGIKSGALASTVAHDSHNIIALGVDDEDIMAAVEEIGKMHGGLVVVNKRKAIASVPLPIAGLISDRPVHMVAEQAGRVNLAAKNLGVKVAEPFSAMSFLALPVVPELKLTDKGLVDVKEFAIVDLFV